MGPRLSKMFQEQVFHKSKYTSDRFAFDAFPLRMQSAVSEIEIRIRNANLRTLHHAIIFERDKRILQFFRMGNSIDRCEPT